MITLLLTIAKNDKYFTDDILLIDHNDSVTYNMDEENIDKIKELLPSKYENKIIISIGKVTDVVINKGVNSD